MSQPFRRKPIAALMATEDTGHPLKRVLGAGDRVMLAIGAVIGAGIYGAGPSLVFSFLLLRGACALAALCYAEFASMIPQAGSAYAYCSATLGQFIAWIVGWDLILEYAVGNGALAISWSDYFTTLLRGSGLDLPVWLTTGYRTAALSSNPAVHALVETVPRVLGLPLLVNLPAFGIVLLMTWLLLRGVRESTTANNATVIVKLLALGLFIAVGLGNVFFAYIGFDALSTPAGETVNPQRNLPIGILGGLAICISIYVVVGAVLTGMVAYQQLAVAGPLARALEIAGFTTGGWVVALGAAVSMAAVLLVFQYGQPRIFFAMARDGRLPQWAAQVLRRTRVPYVTTLLTGGLVSVAAALGDAAETYDLTHIGTLFAFALVCLGVLVLRVVEFVRPRLFRVPVVWLIAPLGAAACGFIMIGLPPQAWERFGLWLVAGLVVYGAYGCRHSRLRDV